MCPRRDVDQVPEKVRFCRAVRCNWRVTSIRFEKSIIIINNIHIYVSAPGEKFRYEIMAFIDEYCLHELFCVDSVIFFLSF